MFGADQRALRLLAGCLQAGAHQQMFQLANIARPVIGLQQLQCLRMQANLLQPQLAARLIEKIAAQPVDIPRMGAQGRHGDGVDLEAMIEVGAEATGGHLIGQIPIGGGD